MPGYRELLEEYHLLERDDGAEGTKGFVEETAGTSTLPTIGDEFDATHIKCKARSLDYRYLWWDSATSTYKRKIIVNYSTRAGSSPVITPDADERRFQLGGEILAVEDPTGWVWHLKNVAIQDTQVFLSNPVGSFTRQRTFTSSTSKKAWIQNKLIVQAGTINDRVFEDYRIGAVLFSGVEGGTQYDNKGKLIWVFNLTFSWRIIRAAGGKDYAGNPIVKDDWRYIWNKDAGGAGTGAWDQPKDANGNFLYDRTNFNLLF